MNTRRMRRIAARRERHSSRSTAVSVALVLVALGGAYLGTECVLAAVGAQPLLAAPADLVRLAVEDEPRRLGIAAVLAVLGIIALVLALTLGGRPRHRVERESVTVIVDDEVLASGLSRAAADSAGVPRQQVRTSVSRNRAAVRVTPVSGRAVAQSAVAQAVASAVTAVGARPVIRSRVQVAEEGVIPR